MSTKRWTTSKFKEFLEEQAPDFELRSEYVNTRTEITLYHKTCKKEFSVLARSFKEGKKCKHCVWNRKRTTEEFKMLVKEQVGREYSVLGEYINADTHIEMKHNICGHVYMVTPDKFLNAKRRCPKHVTNTLKTTDEFKKEVYEAVGKEYEVLGNYTGAHNKIRLKHNSKRCKNHEFEMAPTDFLHGQRCSECGLLDKTGENHWKYNFKLTYEDRLARDMQNGEIRKWRNKVYERDNYTCQICKVVGTKLNAHHINSWDIHEEERFDISNGVTLCENCHTNFHIIYGYGKNTKAEFNHYLTNLNKKQLTLF